jgi:hypothetical protein
MEQYGFQSNEKWKSEKFNCDINFRNREINKEQTEIGLGECSFNCFPPRG